jgi:DNA polymerase I-like protein with 3'-5' exonuclease and polymerase domains
VRVADYVRHVLTPGNVAVSRLRMNGLPTDRERIRKSIAKWKAECGKYEERVVDWGASRGMALKFSAAHQLPKVQLQEVLFGDKGLGLPMEVFSEITGEASTGKGALMKYASIMNPRPDDDPIVTAILKLRSLHKAVGTYGLGYEKLIRADGCLHSQFSWALRTARLSAEKPNIQNITERADKEVADEIKSWFVPRCAPAPSVEEWDPRVHGSVFRWDIAGAEAVIRIACLTKHYGYEDLAYDLLRKGMDIHSKTACVIFDKPDGTFKKGDLERDGVGKNTTFAKIYGATWKTVQRTVWEKARHWLDDDEAKAVSDNWEKLYPGVMAMYERDKEQIATLGYVEDGYGRRRFIELPKGVVYAGRNEHDKVAWRFPRDLSNEEFGKMRWAVENACHMAANTPTQSMSASDCLWMVALTTLGEYVPLRLPPMWADQGLMFPEAAGWRMNEGPGPGGEPTNAWYSNTVHDSAWGDAAPGRHIETAAKIVWRRCQAVPMDWRIETDVPYRVEFKVGPDHAHLLDYNKVAAKFGFEPLPSYR